MSEAPGTSPADAGGDDGGVAATERIAAHATRLRELAERLRDPGLADEQAAELAREAAELVSEAGNELDRALRAASPEG